MMLNSLIEQTKRVVLRQFPSSEIRPPPEYSKKSNVPNANKEVPNKCHESNNEELKGTIFGNTYCFFHTSFPCMLYCTLVSEASLPFEGD